MQKSSTILVEIARSASQWAALGWACLQLGACSPDVFDHRTMAETAADASMQTIAPAERGGHSGSDVRGGKSGAAGRASGAGGTATGGRGGVGADADTAGRGGGSDAPASGSEAVPTDAFLWFAADQAEADASGAVLEWKNLGADARTARAAGSDSAPKIVMVDQRKWLAFDGAAELILPTVPAISAVSFFAVVNADHAADGLRCPSLLHFANRAASSVVQTARLEFGRHMAELLYQVESNEITPSKGSGLFPPDAPHLLSVIHASDRIVRLHVDAEPIKEPVMVDLPQRVERGFNYIGNNHYYANNMPYCQAFQGRIAEILLFDRGVSDDERARIEGYLATKWGLPLER